MTLVTSVWSVTLVQVSLVRDTARSLVRDTTAHAVWSVTPPLFWGAQGPTPHPLGLCTDAICGQRHRRDIALSRFSPRRNCDFREIYDFRASVGFQAPSPHFKPSTHALFEQAPQNATFYLPASDLQKMASAGSHDRDRALVTRRASSTCSQNRQDPQHGMLPPCSWRARCPPMLPADACVHGVG